MPLTSTAPSNKSIAVVGGGPVGLMMASLLSARGITTTLYEKSSPTVRGSRAIGLTPPSLKLFQELGLLESLLENASIVKSAAIFENGSLLGRLSFNSLSGDFPYLLSSPQEHTENVLLQHLKKTNFVTLRHDDEVTGFFFNQNGVSLTLKNNITGLTASHSHTHVIAADGSRSVIRRQLNPLGHSSYSKHLFLMADSENNPSDLGSEAHLYFSKRGPVESFPVGKNKRRWIVLWPFEEEASSSPEVVSRFITLIEERTSHRLPFNELSSFHFFKPKFYLAPTWVNKNVFLIGDAAHLISPIGGQGLNAGFDDAKSLVEHLVSQDKKVDRWVARQKKKLLTYHRRSKFYESIGTGKGFAFSFLRRMAIRLFLNRAVSKQVAEQFAMLR